MMADGSWQLAQSSPPLCVTSNGFSAVGGAWHVSHMAPATGAWTLVFRSFGCAELWGLWQPEQDT